MRSKENNENLCDFFNDMYYEDIDSEVESYLYEKYGECDTEDVYSGVSAIEDREESVQGNKKLTLNVELNSEYEPEVVGRIDGREVGRSSDVASFHPEVWDAHLEDECEPDYRTASTYDPSIGGFLPDSIPTGEYTHTLHGNVEVAMVIDIDKEKFMKENAKALVEAGFERSPEREY